MQGFIRVVVASVVINSAAVFAECPCQSQGTSDQTVVTQSLTGKLTQINARAKTIAVISHGKTYYFHFTDPAQAKVGEVVDVIYVTGNGGLPRATSLASAKSNG